MSTFRGQARTKPYELVLTTRATRDIAARYGSLDQLGDRLEQSENFDEALGEIIWLVTLLANQAILIHNLTATEQQPLLTQEMVELLTVPADLAEYKDAITEALIRGTRRNIVSEEKAGNV
ncbi:phage protein [Corynebacterium diphtheriae]|nr:phage protein [Corynebacterium diphtheriae]